MKTLVIILAALTLASPAAAQGVKKQTVLEPQILAGIQKIEQAHTTKPVTCSVAISGVPILQCYVMAAGANRPSSFATAHFVCGSMARPAGTPTTPADSCRSPLICSYLVSVSWAVAGQVVNVCRAGWLQRVAPLLAG